MEEVGIILDKVIKIRLLFPVFWLAKIIIINEKLELKSIKRRSTQKVFLYLQDDVFDKMQSSMKTYTSHQLDELDESDLYKVYKVCISYFLNFAQTIFFFSALR